MGASIPATLTITGTIQDSPSVGNPPGIPAPPIPLSQTFQLVSSGTTINFDLTSDSPQAVNLAQFANGVTVIFCETSGGYVDLTLTSADGTAQVIPVGPMAIICSTMGKPYTAISITRQAGTEVFAQLYLAYGS